MNNRSIINDVLSRLLLVGGICLLFSIQYDFSFAESVNHTPLDEAKAKIPRISPHKALQLVNTGKVFLLDADNLQYRKGKCPIIGARCIPEEKLHLVQLKLPKNIPILCFCH